MIKLFTILIAFIAFSSETQTLTEPSIISDGKDKVIIMNDTIKNLITLWDSEAKILEPDNFSKEIWSLYTKDDPNSLPMAAVGDYNGDNIKDLGLLVRSGNSIKAIVAISSAGSYTIQVIREFNLNTSDIVATHALHDKKSKYNVYLFAEDKKHLKHKKGLELRDGFQIEKLDSSDTTVHYAIHKKFVEYKGLIR